MQSRRKADDEPPTLRPPFDPAVFARDSENMLHLEESATVPASTRPTQPPPVDYAPSPESEMVSVSLSVESDDVPVLTVARDQVDMVALSALARALLRHVNERDTVSVLCSRAGMRMDDAVAGLEELVREGVISFHRVR
jgi:hypothetical protein